MNKHIPIFGLLLGMCAGVIAEPMVNTADLSDRLKNATVKLHTGYSGHCTAFKIGPRQFMTAGHCTAPSTSNKIEGANSLGYHFQAYVTKGSRKKDSRRVEDWGIVHTSTDDDAITTLELSCGEVIYPGQMVAYFGFSADSKGVFGFGRITTLEQPGGVNDADFGIVIPAAPGSSGSAIVSIDTGKVIGILTEGVAAGRIGFYMVGVESIENVPQCAGKDQEKMKAHT